MDPLAALGTNSPAKGMSVLLKKNLMAPWMKLAATEVMPPLEELTARREAALEARASCPYLF